MLILACETRTLEWFRLAHGARLASVPVKNVCEAVTEPGKKRLRRQDAAMLKVNTLLAATAELPPDQLVVYTDSDVHVNAHALASAADLHARFEAGRAGRQILMGAEPFCWAPRRYRAGCVPHPPGPGAPGHEAAAWWCALSRWEAKPPSAG